MIKFFVALAVAVASVSGLTVEESHLGRFNNWKAEYGKTYASINEEEARFEVFMLNDIAIDNHNSDPEATYTQGHNQFSDMTAEEFVSHMTGYIDPMGHTSLADDVHHITDSEPAAVDWRNMGKVTAVKNQGRCGSCWAFSVTGAVESANLIKNGGTQMANANIVSEQQLVDCTMENHGCNGGIMDYAFAYLKGLKARGDDTESSYPYIAKDSRCHSAKGTPSMIHVTRHTDVRGGEPALKNAVGTIGPVSIAVEADQKTFQFYKSGIVTKKCGTNLNHGVLVVGYAMENNVDYWIVKNSWGASWGESGYIRIAMGKNLCGVSNQPAYPTVE